MNKAQTLAIMAAIIRASDRTVTAANAVLEARVILGEVQKPDTEGTFFREALSIIAGRNPETRKPSLADRADHCCLHHPFNRGGC